MGITMATLSSSSGLDALKAMKNMLKTGWTLDEENQILWKDSPAAFPVGFASDRRANTTADCIHAVVKANDGSVIGRSTTSVSGLEIAPSDDNYLTLYTSPNGSLAFSISNTYAPMPPELAIIKNGNTDATLPTYIPLTFQTVANINMLIPGTKILNMTFPVLTNLSSAVCLRWALTQAAEPYTGTPANDFYWLSSYADTSTDPPLVLVSGSAKYVKMYRGSTSVRGGVYMRYI